jgi:hypothetical protein
VNAETPIAYIFAQVVLAVLRFDVEVQNVEKIKTPPNSPPLALGAHCSGKVATASRLGLVRFG